MGLRVDASNVDAVAVGDRRLTAEKCNALDDVGWVVVPAVLATDEVGALRDEFERLIAADPKSRSNELGCRRTNAGRENEATAICWRHRVLLDAATHVLGPAFEVGGVDLRDPNPGAGYQQFHPDHGPEPVPGITATWFIDEFTADNGATRVIDGSHRGAPGMTSVAVGPAGSVLLRDARLQHAGEINRTTGHRRAALVFYQHDIPDGTCER